MNEETNPLSSEYFPPTDSAPDQSEEIGSQIGAYKLLQMIGEGGMGTVYMAEQEKPIQRRVALKIIKSGMDSKQVVARFEAERQALSMMDHSNIAHVLDVGTTDRGRPYFVMELIKGLPITRFCDEKNLTISQRLRIFKSVCNAVQHAHQKGIIHRDLKPSNILVAECDGKPVPKIIDFGLAKALHQRLTDKTMFTQIGQVVGTFEYMSPEQSSMNQLEVDTRTDIYSLGVLLYELLTGTVPFDRKRMRSAALDQVIKIIREEDPPKPSLRLSTVESSAEIASHRSVEPKRLGILLRGDLDWIVMKAMEKDRDRRYETANGFAMDVKRYLDGDTVNAVPPSAGYRMRKFIKRNRASVVAGSIVTAILILGVIGTSWGMFWALNEKDKARSAQSAEARAKDDALREAENARNQEKKAKRLRQLADQRTVRAEKAERMAALREYFSKIKLAQSEWNHGDPALAVRTLRACPWHLRGWEHDYLFTLFHRNHKTLRGQLSISYCVGFSPDGRRIVSGGSWGKIKIWDAESGERSLTFNGHDGSILSVAFSSDGTRVVSGSRDKTVRIWDAENGEEIFKLSGHSGDVRSVAFSPDGRRVVSGSWDHTIKIWDAESGIEISTLEGHSERVSSVAFSPDGRWIVSGSWDRTVRIWDTESKKEVDAVAGHQVRVHCVTFSPDGTRFVSGDFDGNIRIWDANTREEILTIKDTERGYVQSVAFSPDGKQIVSGGYHARIKIWDAETGSERYALSGHSTVVNSVAYSPNGHRIVSADHEGTIKIWDFETNIEQPAFDGHSSEVLCLAFSPNSRRIVSGDESGEIRIWDAVGSEECLILNGHTGSIQCVAFSPDVKWIVSGSKDESIKIWNAESGNEIATLIGHNDQVNSVAFSSDSQRIVSGSSDESIKIWDRESGLAVATLDDHSNQVSSVAFSPDDTQIVSGDYAMNIHIWDLETNKQVLTLDGHHGSVRRVTFSPDGKLVASGSIDKTVRIWDAKTGREILTLTGHSEDVSSVAFSPDSK